MSLIFFVLQKFPPFSIFIILGMVNVFGEKSKSSIFLPTIAYYHQNNGPICMKFGLNPSLDVHIECPEWQDRQTVCSIIKKYKCIRGQNFDGVVVIRVLQNNQILWPQNAWNITEKNIETYFGPQMLTPGFIWLHMVTR